MKKSIIYLAISATLTFSGCDYLDDMPYDWNFSLMIFLRMNRTI
ncbi:hypothetical protein NXX52_08140 [Bacteroides ovatus]|nr:hypothetical protein [Bacteroides ovatus]